MRRDTDGTRQDVTPAPFNVRTRVHEYGGGAYCATENTTVFSNFTDQRVYRLDAGGVAVPITPDAGNSALRYADFIPDTARQRFICVREDHREHDASPRNDLVALDLGGNPRGGQVLATGADFYASPRLSPDGSHLAWLTWNHPNMPWDGTELWIARIQADGTLTTPVLVAGGPRESVFQPEWSPSGSLHFVSDRSGWWNLYRWTGAPPREHGTVASHAEPLASNAAEFGLPQWVFGMSTYGFADDGTLVCAYTHDGTWQLATVPAHGSILEKIATPFTDIGYIRVHGARVLFLAGSTTAAPAIVQCNLDGRTLEPLRTTSASDINPDYLSGPKPLTWLSTNGDEAHGFFYPPANQDFRPEASERPPLIVLSHGGPTGQTSSTLNLALQYWTSRGFAVLDVNYGGSTGYGRAYRERLLGQWGVVDVDDCVTGAQYLVHGGYVDGDRLAIRGWSASGFTTLAALTFRNVFKAGASHYGVSELEALALDTHKFESRYLDSLIGPYPECKALYAERSPLHAVERMSAPLILFQGLDDKVVPPNQAELMYAAVKAKGIPVALVEFAGEQHGFKRAENIRRALDSELWFLGRIFGFTPAGNIEPVAIANLPSNT